MKTEELARRIRALGNRPAAYMGDYVLTSEAADALEAQAKEIERLRAETSTFLRLYGDKLSRYEKALHEIQRDAPTDIARIAQRALASTPEETNGHE